MFSVEGDHARNCKCRLARRMAPGGRSCSDDLVADFTQQRREAIASGNSPRAVASHHPAAMQRQQRRTGGRFARVGPGIGHSHAAVCARKKGRRRIAEQQCPPKFDFCFQDGNGSWLSLAAAMFVRRRFDGHAGRGGLAGCRRGFCLAGLALGGAATAFLAAGLLLATAAARRGLVGRLTILAATRSTGQGRGCRHGKCQRGRDASLC